MRLHFNDQLTRSLLAHLWIGLAAVVGLLVVGIGSGLGLGLGTLVQIRGLGLGVGAVLGGLAAVAGMLYASARFAAAGAAMTRMGMMTLMRRYEPSELYRDLMMRRSGRYLVAALLSTLMIATVYGLLILLGIGLLFLAQTPWRILLAQTTNPLTELGFGIGAFLCGMLYIAAVGLVGYYFTARLWFYDAVLAMEPQQTSFGSLLRSWELTRGRSWSVTNIMFVTSLITFPLYGISALINLVVPIFSLLAGVLFFPLWQSVKAASYYELAATRTGLRFDLETPASNPRDFLRRVTIQTPEGVGLDFALGGAGSRALAWIFDQVVLYLLLTGLFLTGLILYANVIFPVLADRLDLSMDTLNLWAGAISSLVAFAITNGYYIYCETFRRGQTPGKQFTGIRVVRDDGQPISIREATLRSFVGWIDLGFFAIGLIFIIFKKSEQRLGDLAAGTLVIQDEKAVKQQALQVPDRFDSLTTDTVAVLEAHGDPKALSFNQYLILRNFLGSRDQLGSRDRAQVTHRLAMQLRHLLVASTPETFGTIPDENLIEAVYLANQPAYQGQ